jgi:surface carbohydrate biosynthesis protein
MTFTKIIILIKRFLRSKKNWSLPRQNKLLLYDACENNFLIDFLKPWKPSMFYIRGEEIYIIVLLLSFFKFKNLKEAYTDVFINFVEPALIISFNDNSPYFFSISKRFENVKTLFIQNGWRAYYGDIFEYLEILNKFDLSKYKVDFKIFFGEVNSNYFSRYINEGTSINIGSIRNNHFIKRASKEKDLIIFVSQWNGSDFKTLKNNYSEDIFFKPTDFFIVDFLNNYCKKKSMRFKVLLRNSFNQENIKIEKKYYQSLINEKLDFIVSDNNFNAYDATDAAEIVVGIESTLLYESIARGNKTAIFSVRDDILFMDGYHEFKKIQGFTFGWPGKFSEKGFFWTNKASNNDLLDIMNNLRHISHEEWREMLKSFSFDSLMGFDPGNKMLKNILRDELESHNL